MVTMKHKLIDSVLPDVEICLIGGDLKPFYTTTPTFFQNKKIVVFGLPGAFTPVCSSTHVPGYIDILPEFLEKNVDSVICLSVNDPCVMVQWAKDLAIPAEKFYMLADGNGDLTKALGLEVELKKLYMGIRCQRFSMVVKNGVIDQLSIEESLGQCGISDAAQTIQRLN